MSEIQLRVHELHKTFDPGLFEAKKRVLRGVSFEVRKGEVFGFLGPNGAGKTTTIKAITELIYADSGEITIFGRPHTDPEVKAKIGFMPENPYFYNHLTGREFLRFYADLLRVPRGEAGGRIEGLLEQVSLADRGGDKMRTYSKGMLQRIGLAQALIGEPDLLILDEPMSGLDPLGRRDVRDIILGEKEKGTTIFFSSHIIPDVETICDKVAILLEGKVQAVGAVRDIVAQEIDFYELTFTGIDPAGLETPVAASHAGSASAWVRVGAEHREELIKELSGAGARLVSLNPVRSSLEDYLLSKYKEVKG